MSLWQHLVRLVELGKLHQRGCSEGMVRTIEGIESLTCIPGGHEVIEATQVLWRIEEGMQDREATTNENQSSPPTQ
jgi:hypothetical protein